ncbi:MAG: sialate O-acetylesterase, partial [Verrucomicrobiota bacterium]
PPPPPPPPPPPVAPPARARPLRELPEGKFVLEKKRRAVETWDEERLMKRYEEELKKWEVSKKGRKPRKPIYPEVNPGMHSVIYQGMIAPLVGYGMRGVIWYQGESNSNAGTAGDYGELLGCMVGDWRERWGADFSFYFVQLANFKEATTEPGVESDWVLVQDEQRRALMSIPKSGLAVINDIGVPDDVHPTNKKDVGLRLVKWALAKDYGKDSGLLCGPLFSGVEEKDGVMVVSFDYGEGLKARDGGELKRFEIKAEDGAWMWARARIEEGKVLVWSEKIADPEHVRYAWASNPEGANLVNGEGLPASCFTTESKNSD